jgi:hypothetical protein
MREGERERER